MNLTPHLPQVTAIQRDSLDRAKWKEVPTVPSLAPDEEEKDPFEVGRIYYGGFMLRYKWICMKANIS